MMVKKPIKGKAILPGGESIKTISDGSEKSKEESDEL